MPVPEDGTGVLYYAATILCPSRARYLELQALLSVVTVKPAIGLMGGGTAVVEKGPGERSLIYPDGDAEVTVDAILVSWSPAGRVGIQSAYEVSARWLITGALA